MSKKLIAPHEDRPKECSTKFLETIEKTHENHPNVDFEPFLDELKKRRKNKRDLKVLRAHRRANALERKLKAAAHHQEFHGDVRKMK